MICAASLRKRRFFFATSSTRARVKVCSCYASGVSSAARSLVREQLKSLLLLEDDETFRRRLAHSLRQRGYDVIEAADLAEGVQALKEREFHFVIVDLRIPGGSGLDLVRIAAVNLASRIVVLTGFGSIATALAAIRLGAFDYMTKPVDVDEIVRTLEGSDKLASTSPDLPLDFPSPARVEWEYLNRVVAETGGNISEAARRLGLHRRSLQRKLAKFPPRH